MLTGIIIVDHGSRRTQSNKMLEEVAALFAQRFTALYDIVEPAHMELAEPSIAAAYASCVNRGATQIIICPFFLGPGKHWTSDIPGLAAEAQKSHPATQYHVTMPLGIDELILELLNKRAQFCINHNYRCDSCKGTLRSGEPGIEIAVTETAHANPNGQCSTCPFTVNPDGTITDKRNQPAAI